LRNGGELMIYSLGIADEHFVRGNIPMTKEEVRVQVLAKAQIKRSDTVIDIGAGTGSISVEAALQAIDGKVYAIEREPEGVELIRKNANKFCAGNIVVIPGLAPAALEKLPDANVIIIGGSGGHLEDILAKCDNLLKPEGRLIMTAVTIETLYKSLNIMQNNPSYTVSAFGLQVTRIKQVGSSNMLQALNPIYIVACTKGGNDDKTR